eukprot:CAMPEP_0177629612 /NCGR_PEP_ID=MMETSP0447-20121125/762_1 /TAXON_ID=0 /ORGANISM="Stygamoeba regulata, Strain BSH-02190019" /LENGTH=79 /DNA_ID=CAMNT_0019130947 /DNA_START=319 /DNA_END=554 /DNA_ORIENTATION=-
MKAWKKILLQIKRDQAVSARSTAQSLPCFVKCNFELLCEALARPHLHHGGVLGDMCNHPVDIVLRRGVDQVLPPYCAPG